VNDTGLWFTVDERRGSEKPVKSQLIYPVRQGMARKSAVPFFIEELSHMP